MLPRENADLSTKENEVRVMMWYQQLSEDVLRSFFDGYTNGALRAVMLTDLNQLEANIRAFKLLGTICPAMKTNSNPELWRLLAWHGMGADIASEEERRAALEAGVPSEKLTLFAPSYPCKKDGTPDLHLPMKVLKNGGKVVIHSSRVRDELNRLYRESPDQFCGEVFVRVNTGMSLYKNAEEYQELTGHGHKGSQFGVPLEDVLAFLDEAEFPVVGIHNHPGTMMDNLEAFKTLLGLLHKQADRVNQNGHHTIHSINMGGGLGVGKGFPSITQMVEVLKPLLREGVEYIFEPGNAIFGNATVLVTEVGDVLTAKDADGKEIQNIILNYPGFLKVTLAGFPQALMCKGKLLEPGGNGRICGNFCFSGDVSGQGMLVTGMEPGDLVLFLDAGGYVFPLLTNFNGHPMPAHVLIRDGKFVCLGSRAQRLEEYASTLLHFENPPTEEGFEPVPFDTEKLVSTYLANEIGGDKMKILSAHQVGEGRYLFETEVTSSLGQGSMPTFLRDYGQLTIVAVTHHVGFTAKGEKSVVSPLGRQTMDGAMPSNTHLRVRVDLSHFSKVPKGFKGLSVYSVLAYMKDGEWQELAPDRFTGMFDVLVEGEAG